jgi:predicted RNase H-like HicB family nuclease
VRDTLTVIHRNGQGSPDYVIVLTFEYSEESAKWVGVCLELGTSAFADTLEQVREELREAVELQLNELERSAFVQDFLEENHVRIVQIGPGATSQEAGFAVATSTR